MIEEARKASPAITYIVAPASQLPFQPGTFDTVTAFSAFHWFCDKQSLAEIRRVLKEKGKFFVINKNDISGFLTGHRHTLGQFLGKKLPSPKDNYDPATILRTAGFEVTAKTFLSKERFSPDGALIHIQSGAFWNEVPAKREEEAIQLMKNHIAKTAIGGEAVRKLEILVVSATVKP